MLYQDCLVVSGRFLLQVAGGQAMAPVSSDLEENLRNHADISESFYLALFSSFSNPSTAVMPLQSYSSRDPDVQ